MDKIIVIKITHLSGKNVFVQNRELIAVLFSMGTECNAHNYLYISSKFN